MINLSSMILSISRTMERSKYIPDYVVSQSSYDECEKENVTPVAKCYNCISGCNIYITNTIRS